jgi:hypothetical protein
LLQDLDASYLAPMLQQKITRLAAAFAAQIIGVLTAAPLDELVNLASGPTSRPVVRAKAPSAKKKTRPQKSTAPAPSAPSAEVTTAALAFFGERGSRGATAQQVGERLAELGLAAPNDVVDVLAKSGGIRDAGFRRAAGKNATAPVYVAT